MIDAENEPLDSVIENRTKPSFYEKVINAPMAYKVILPLVVTGIMTVGVAWVSMSSQTINPQSSDLLLSLKVKEHDDQKNSLLQASKKEYEFISRLLGSISDRIGDSKLVQIETSRLVESGLSDLTENIKKINEVIADLKAGQKDLSHQFSESNSEMAVIAKDVQLLKVVKKKHASEKMPRSVKKPPFVIDAIDVWDDVSYVAISQSGHVSFLKVGDQQAGWTLTDINHLKAQVSFQGAAGNVYSTSIKR